jgi:lysyl endopeptidase
MKIRFLTPGLSFLLLAMVVPCVLWGADALPAASQWPVQSLDAVQGIQTLEMDRTALARQDRIREEQGEPYRFAEVQKVSLTPEAAGTWETLPNGKNLWRLRINAPDVLSLNLGFTRFWMPADARLLVYPASGEGPVLAFDETDNADHGELWTRVLIAKEVVVELEVDPAFRWQVELELTDIGRGYRYFGEDLADKSGACNIDVICPEGNDWRDEIATVGVYSLGGSTFCTGFMINNTDEDGTPYFVTAYHCDVRAGLAPSIVVYWNFDSPSCGQQGAGSLDDVQNGSTLRAEYETSDVALLELDDFPDPAFGVTYAGWNRTNSIPSSAVCIHHPNTDEKSISFEDDPLTVTSYRGSTSPGDGTHLQVRDWDLGTTEGGSSGSPLFDENHYVVGQLHGGQAACGNNERDWYGWFHVSWNGGGAAESRLRDWLDPSGSGAETVETVGPFGNSFSVSPGDGFTSSGFVGGSFSPADMTYTLTNPSGNQAQFSATVGDPWVTVSPASGSINSGESVEVVVSLTAAASELAIGKYSSALQINNTSAGAGNTTRPVSLTVVATTTRITGVVPNPFGSGAVPETQIQFILSQAATVHAKIYDIRGGMVKDLGSMAGVAGDNHFTWDGTGQGGARQASGAYVFIMQTLGLEEKIGIMLAH